MDLEAFVAVNRPDWDRLDELTRRKNLDAVEVDELALLYSQASTQLSLVQAQAPQGPITRGLSITIARARQKLTGRAQNVSVGFTNFFTVSLPYAFYQIRWLTVIIGLLFCVVAFSFGAWINSTPEALNALLSPAQQKQYVEEDFVSYYSENPAASFGAAVWTNNAWIAAQAVAFGITGVWVAIILFVNAQGLGITGGMMALHGELDTFFLYILPHGFMELTAIFIASAAGLRIFWAWIAPGRFTRMQSLAYQGRSLITVAVGLVFVLLISGIVEAVVTPAPWPHWLRIGIGAAVLAAYWVYTLVVGGRVARAGLDAELGEFDAGARPLTA